MDRENRIVVLEKEVYAIKSELAVIRRDHVDATELNGRVQRAEFEITQLQKSASQLTADVLQLKEEVVSICQNRTHALEYSASKLRDQGRHEGAGGEHQGTDAWDRPDGFVGQFWDECHLLC